MSREKPNRDNGRKIGGGPPPPTDDRAYGHRPKPPSAKRKSKSAALDVTASPGIDDIDKKRRR